MKYSIIDYLKSIAILIILLIVLILITLYIINQSISEKQYTEINGIVTKVEDFTTINETTTGSYPNHNQYVHYKYTIDNTDYKGFKVTKNSNFYKDQTIKVYYNPSKPAKSILTTKNIDSYIWLLLSGMVIVIIALIGITIIYIKS